MSVGGGGGGGGKEEASGDRGVVDEAGLEQVGVGLVDFRDGGGLLCE